jgi:hypothetical protein
MSTRPEKASERRAERPERHSPDREQAGSMSPVLAARGVDLNRMGNRALGSMLRAGQLQRKERGAEAVVTDVPSKSPEGREAVGSSGGALASQLSGGDRLDVQTRDWMESRFGESFDEVRIHTDSRAAQMADALQASAFTVDRDIVFGEGQFAPQTTEGKRLLAHELAHVVQQRGTVGALAGEKSAEGDADKAAHTIASGSKAVVMERAAAGIVQRQERESQFTSRPGVTTSTSVIHVEMSRASVQVEGRLVATGTTSSFDHPHDDGGVWDSATRTETIRVFLARFATLSSTPRAGDVARDLGMTAIVIIPIVEGEEQSSIFIAPSPPKASPAPPKPSLPPAPLQPKPLPPTLQPEDTQKQPEKIPEPSSESKAAPPSTQVKARERLIRANLQSFTFNISWDREIVQAFRDSSGVEFQQLQDALGEDGMSEVFDQLDPFRVTLVGSFGSITKGQSKLTEKRAEWILEFNRWVSNQKSFMYYWMLETMQSNDIQLLLNYLAKESYLNETFKKQQGMKEYLARRGINLDTYQDTHLDPLPGIGRGAKKWGKGIIESIPLVRDSPRFDWEALPEPYKSKFFESAGKDLFEALTPSNIARGTTSEVTLGLSEIPFAIWGAGSAVWAGAEDIASGNAGKGFEKVTPVLLTIIAILLTRKASKLGTAGPLATFEGESALLAPKGGTPVGPFRGLKLIPAEPTSNGMLRFIAVNADNEMAEVILDPHTNSGRFFNMATKEAIYFENGQVVRGPAGLLPPSAAGELPLDPFGRIGLVPPPARPGAISIWPLPSGGREFLPLLPSPGAPSGFLLPVAPEPSLGSFGGSLPLLLPPGPTIKGLLPPWLNIPRPLPPPGMTAKEMAEGAALRPMRPNGRLLTEKSTAFDAFDGGDVRISYHIDDLKDGNPIIVMKRVISGADAISIKELDISDAKHVRDNVNDALANAWHHMHNPPLNEPRRGRTPVAGTTDAYFRDEIRDPKKITVIIQAPGHITKEMENAAKAAAAAQQVNFSIPVEAFVQPVQ